MVLTDLGYVKNTFPASYHFLEIYTSNFAQIQFRTYIRDAKFEAIWSIVRHASVESATTKNTNNSWCSTFLMFQALFSGNCRETWYQTPLNYSYIFPRQRGDQKD